MTSSLDIPVCPLYISAVVLDFSKSKKNVESAEVRISSMSPTPINGWAGKAAQQTFSPPMKLSLEDTLSLHVRYKTWFGNKHEDIVVEPADIFQKCNAGERQEYNMVHKKITIVVELSGNPTTEQIEQFVSSDESLELLPTTDEIFRKCPQFRILVIGKTGVGKSSLINHAFGVQNATASHDKPGEVSIDHEFTSLQNKRFVLHDSKGFEPGEKDNLKVVRDFIDRRRAMPDLKNKLHAIWLCFEIPRAGGRLLETGVEQFLTSKHKGELGNIPIIAVFTKYDTLLDRVERTLDKPSIKGLSKAAIQDLIKKHAEDKLQEVCVAPLEKFAKSAVPHVTVSTNGNHEETLTHLIKTTEELVHNHVGADASVMTSVAQRVDPGLKIKASIEVGKRKYWKALASSIPFKKRSMWDCLHVLHADIVNVWNFQDPHGYLCSPEFRTLMTNMVNELDVGPTADSKKTLSFGLTIVGTIATIVSALSGPAAPIVVPIAASVVIASWVLEVYEESRPALQRFMKYIIDLTLVLQTLVLVAGNQELSRKAIKLAVKSYHESPMSGEVHNRIHEHDRQSTPWQRANRDSLDQLVALLQLYDISAEEVSSLRGRLPDVDLSSDEPWGA
jgi:GTPase SAR1 family protein